MTAAKKNIPINYEAWARNAITFIRERGLEREFTDWCGGWPCPIASAASPEPPDVVGVLEPFAELATEFCCDDRPADEIVRPSIRAGELQAARALLSQLRGDG